MDRNSLFLMGFVFTAIVFMVQAIVVVTLAPAPKSPSGTGTPATVATGTGGLPLPKDIAAIVKDSVTVVAIGVGGAWTYLLFIRRRQKYPRAKITHDIMHRSLTTQKTLLRIAVTISNSGDVLLSLVSEIIRIQQILPPPSEVLHSIAHEQDLVREGQREALWPSIGSRRLTWAAGKFEIEPGESDELHHDFVIDADVQTIKVYTYFTNLTKRDREIGWRLTTIYDLRSPSAYTSIDSSLE